MHMLRKVTKKRSLLCMCYVNILLLAKKFCLKVMVIAKHGKKRQIESRIMGELATSHVLPAAIRYQNLLANNIKGLKESGLKESAFANQKQILEKISEHISKTGDLVEKMIEARKICNNIEGTRTKAIAYQSQVKDAFFDDIRYHVDKLELLVDDREWYLPKYREILFLR